MSQAPTKQIRYGTLSCHDTPKRSVTMPKQGEKKVLPSGIETLPPPARAVPTSRTRGRAPAEWSDGDVAVVPELPDEGGSVHG